MSRSNKAATTQRKHGLSLASTLAFLAGLTSGLVVAFLVYLRWPTLQNDLLAVPPASSSSAEVLARSGARSKDAAATQPPSTSYDFYNILPEMEVKVPEASAEAGDGGAEPVADGVYVLQVASFQRFEDADRTKASLALEGITATIEQVQIDGKNTWYRVRVGPIADPAQLQSTRERLRSAYPNAMLLRIKEPRSG
jgi:cell division protein FtsN